ncbi:DNA helicase [Micromonospora fulviviridis]|uniref:UvrD-helicase domain-containing protein n=1 Tax=Micromonospora fulviviridis TaxID=47860 RepID=UPI001668DDA6|nr:UvrD-helicase domain-containing protein [Micromonospora fulviviridis]GGR97559.1 DNA helicase [Micromonospora fulviviridis]
MTARTLAPDTDADAQLKRILGSEPSPSFSVVAGAGSGKTTSLVKALAHVAAVKGDVLSAKGQQIACITYTEVAAEEIFQEVGSNPLVHVSTIHSFLWRIISPFQADIGGWVQRHLQRKIDELAEAGASGDPRRASRAGAAKEKRAHQLAGSRSIRSWTYGVGGDYGRGIVGHSDILSMVPEMLLSRPLLSRIVAAKFPFIFVDESQDTEPRVLEALLHVRRTQPDRICLGFFGDPMQRIHFGGISDIPAERGWEIVKKPENFRSSLKVLSVVNHIRAGADGLHQVSGLPEEAQRHGEVFFFVLPADSERTTTLKRVRTWLDSHSASGNWTLDPPAGAKILLIMHKLAARRLGFENLYAAFHQRGAGSISEAFDEGNAWPLTPLINSILPLCRGASSDVPAVVVRRHGTALSDEALRSVSVHTALSAAKEAVHALRRAAQQGGPGSMGEVLRIAHEAELVTLDPRLAGFLDSRDDNDIALPEATKSVLEALMACDVGELDGYVSYINRASPYSTQHGTKGAEFPRVVVVLDDNEESWSLYSYEKLLGLRPLSITDRTNRAEGRDSVIERTRRLLYVCASRARDSLAIVLYTADVPEATQALERAGYPSADQVFTLEDIGS